MRPRIVVDTNTVALGTNSANTVSLGGLVVLPGSGDVVVLGTPVETGPATQRLRIARLLGPRIRRSPAAARPGSGCSRSRAVASREPDRQLSSAPDDLDVTEDSSGGVYAMWSQVGLHVAYRPKGEATWDAPVLVPQPAAGAISDPTIAGLGGGMAELGFTNNPGTGTQTFLQTVDAIPSTPVTVQVPSTATSTGKTVTFTISCSAACTITVTIEVPVASASDAHGTFKSSKTLKITKKRKQ